MKKALIVAKREIWETLGKRSFWLSLLIFPFFLAIALYIGNYNQNRGINVQTNLKSEKPILIIDEGAYINDLLIKNPYKKFADLNLAKNQLKEKLVSAVFYYPKNLIQTKTIQIYSGDSEDNLWRNMAIDLLKKSLALEIKDPDKQELSLNTPKTEIEALNNKDNEKTGLAIAVMFLYIMVISLSVGMLITSFSEEKENKVMEIINTLIKPGQFILGKLLANIAILVTQLLIITMLMLGAFYLFNSENTLLVLSKVLEFVNGWDLFKAFFYLGCGYLIMANIIIGTGASFPTLKESQNFMSYFILLSIFPIYFLDTLIMDPFGTISIILSYFPLTSAMVLLFRNLGGQLSLREEIFSTVMLILYVIISFLIAFKLFKAGSSEYNKRISIKKALFNN